MTGTIDNLTGNQIDNLLSSNSGSENEQNGNVTGNAIGTVASMVDGEGEAVAAEKVGTTVIDRYPTYIDVAKQIGANYYQIPTELFNSLTPEAQWAMNRQFLEEAIERGNQIINASPGDTGGRWLNK